MLIQTISIHALREEGDKDAINRTERTLNISIHALREEGDRQLYAIHRNQCRFLSTPSARRATITAPQHLQYIPISIHALREEGDGLGWLCRCCFAISIHALREEGDV